MAETDTRSDKKIRLLFIEDNPADYQLCVYEFRKIGIQIEAELVATKAQFLERLAARAHDVIVTDYQLNGWTALDALAILKREELSIPIILLTGALGDEAAVACMKNGMWDYLLKDRLSRLPVAVNRALDEKRVRDHRRKSELALRNSEERFRLLADTIAAAILIYDDKQCRYVNHAAELMSGYSRSVLLQMSFLDLLDPEWRESDFSQAYLRSGQVGLGRHEVKIRDKLGQGKWWDITVGIGEFEQRVAHVTTAIDVTSRKEMEEEIRRLVSMDALTGLGNYRRMVEVLDTEAERSRRSGRPASLILFDLDGLKAINDSRGHQAGSRALCRVANAIRSTCRTIDSAARIGGDEFAVLLPETDAFGAESVATRIADQVRNDREDPGISVCYGTAQMNTGNIKTVEEAFAAADAALYKMKNCRGSMRLA